MPTFTKLTETPKPTENGKGPTAIVVVEPAAIVEASPKSAGELLHEFTKAAHFYLETHGQWQDALRHVHILEVQTLTRREAMEAARAALDEGLLRLTDAHPD